MKSISYTNNIQRKRNLFGIAGALVTLAVPYFIMALHGSGNIETEQSFCPFKMLTGFPCPGCGITKSLYFLYQGDIVKSLYYHIYGPLVVLFCVATVVVLSTELVTGNAYFRNILYSRKIAYLLGYSLAAYHLVRLVCFVYANSFDEILRQSIWK